MKITNKSGFSFLELMIVIAIIGIMTTVGLVSMTKNRIKGELEAEARKVISVIREAQNGALTGKVIDKTHIPCSHFVDISYNNNSKKYYSAYFYKNSGVCDGTLHKETGNYSLESGVTFSNPASSKISFDVPFGGVNATQLVTLKKGSETFSFCVCSSGKIVENVTSCSGSSCS